MRTDPGDGSPPCQPGSLPRSRVRPTSLEITKATYMRPATCSIIKIDLACATTGTTSETPTEVSVVNERKSSSTHVRGASGVEMPR